MNNDLKHKVQQFPGRPGVYVMKNAQSSVIYVGKANNLKKRAGSYFTGTKDTKTRILMKNVAFIENITTRNEYEALLLENTLIKRWQPRYNINLKDGKSYPVIRITNEKFPRVFRTRRIIQDGSEYYGPFPDVHRLDTYLGLIEKLFPLRKCRGPLKKRDHPCLYYHIHRCAAPCAGKISQQEYMEGVSDIKKLLSGKTGDLVRTLKDKMDLSVRDLRFEQAAELRDSIDAVKSLGKEQEVVDFNPETRDYIAAAEREQICTFVVFQMRSGKLIGRDLFRTENYTDLSEASNQFIVQYFGVRDSVPDKLYISELVDTGLLREFFEKEKGRSVEIVAPQRGRHASILRMARENGMEDIEERLRKRKSTTDIKELQTVLGLSATPRRIEGFDISQLNGKHPVASMVTFFDGVPVKKDYRQFHIRTLDGKIDDYEAMREVIARRYTRVLNEKLERPDLILVDGGKGQVGAAKSILNALNLGDIPIAGLAKREEEIFLPGRDDPYRLPETSGALKVLQRVRNESHRFATSLNKRLRNKDLRLSTLENAPGIGPKRAAKLMEEFGSLVKITGASPNRIADACGIGQEKAKQVLSYLANVDFQIPKPTQPDKR